MPVPLGRFISDAVYDRRLESEHGITSSECVKFVDVSFAYGGEESSHGNSWIVSFLPSSTG